MSHWLLRQPSASRLVLAGSTRTTCLIQLLALEDTGRVASAEMEEKRCVCIFWLCTSIYAFLCRLSQGLMEYVKPAWQERPRPKVDETKVKKFGQNVPPRPLNPAKNQLQLYPVTMEIDGSKTPRYISR